MCIAFCKGKARNVEEMPRIYLEGQALSCVLRVKFLGLHINYYLNEDIRDFKCSHYYGCEAWDLK